MTPFALALLELAGHNPHVRARALRIAPVLMAEGHRASIAPMILAAIAWRESSFDQRAVGKRGEVGVMQVAPDTAAQDCPRLDITKLRDNVRCACRLLRKARARCGDAPLRYLSAYNRRRNCEPSRYSRRILSTAGMGTGQ